MAPTEPALRLSWGGARFAVFCAEFVSQTKGRWSGRPLYLEPFQLQYESEMLRTDSPVFFEFTRRELESCLRAPERFYERLAVRLRKLDAEPGRRIYREAYVQTSKKSGKSTTASAHALYFLAADGEQGAEVYSAAAAKDQARIVFGQAREVVLASPRLRDWIRVYRDTLAVPATHGIYRVLSADAAVQEGLNPSAAVIDELHRHKTRDLYDVLTSADIARGQPFTLVITNAGANLSTICGELYGQARDVLDGRPNAREDLFAYVPELAADEFEDRAAWKRVNQASWITIEALERQKRRYPSFVFERRYLNRWSAAADAWLPPGAWDVCRGPEEPEPGDEALVGIDMGLKRDSAGVVTLVPRTGKLIVRARSWVVHADPEKPPPPAHSLITDSDRVNFSLIENAIRDAARNYLLREAVYDPWRFERSAQALAEEGIQMVEWPQTNERMCPASQALYDAIVEGRIVHDGDPILRAHIEAAVVKDTGRGWRLTKKDASRPMDLAVALAMAVARAEVQGSPPTVYWL